MNDISLLNNKQPTYIHPATGSTSSIDLALCSPAIALNYHWQPKNDTFGTDHFPIIISSTKSSSPSPQFQQYWKINKADWTNFAQNIVEFLHFCATFVQSALFIFQYC